jgi:hypothetical protein
MPATLATPGATSTAWTLTSPCPPRGLPAVPEAQDKAGGRADPLLRAVPAERPEQRPPAVTDQRATSGENDFTTNTITVSGAADPDGVQSVRSASTTRPSRIPQSDGTIGGYTVHRAIGHPPDRSTPGPTGHAANGEYTMNVNAVDGKGAALAEAIGGAS